MYDCRWGTDVVRVVVAGELPRETHNAPLHLFSASPDLVNFGRSAYWQRSAETSQVLGQLFEKGLEEGVAMYTMADFQRDYVLDQFLKLTLEEQQSVLKKMPLEQRLAGLPVEQILAKLPVEQIRQYLEQHATRPARPSKRPRKR